METSDALKLVLAAVAVLLLGRLVVGALFAGAVAGMHGSHARLSVLFPILLAAGGLVALVVVAAVSGIGDDETDDDALAELRKRYARGDIDEEEFERRRERLTQR